MTIAEFARSRGREPDTVATYIRRHPDAFKGHTKMIGNTMRLDDAALAILDEVYPPPAPVEIVVDTDALQRLADAQDRIIMLQDRMMQQAQVLADLQAEKVLLEDRQSRAEADVQASAARIADLEQRLAAADARAQAADQEADRLRRRGLIDRIFNR